MCMIFKWQELNLRVLLSICFVFLQCGVANESVVYIKKRLYIDLTNFIFVKKKNEKPVKYLYLKEGASFSIPCILAHFVSFACNVSGYKQESKKDDLPSKLL